MSLLSLIWHHPALSVLLAVLAVLAALLAAQGGVNKVDPQNPVEIKRRLAYQVEREKQERTRSRLTNDSVTAEAELAKLKQLRLEERKGRTMAEVNPLGGKPNPKESSAPAQARYGNLAIAACR
ncbi:hypothetical protein WJX74_003643 [Apatococcus lobatus]|uniref:Uncharacterized protein n=1 Tax=Apatococcus lobatus TaxID=904363 RepID=A0AAW1S8W9_9CHLO